MLLEDFSLFSCLLSSGSTFKMLTLSKCWRWEMLPSVWGGPRGWLLVQGLLGRAHQLGVKAKGVLSFF